MKIISTSLILALFGSYFWAVSMEYLLGNTGIAQGLSIVGGFLIGLNARIVVEWAYGYTLLQELSGRKDEKENSKKNDQV